MHNFCVLILSLMAEYSAVNLLILKLKPVNWKAISGGHQLTGFYVLVQHPSLILSDLILIHTQVLLNTLRIFKKLKIKSNL